MVLRRHRRRLPGLHHRQYPERTVLCRRRQGANRYSLGDRRRRIPHAAWLVGRQHLSSWQLVHAQRPRQARDRRADDHAPLHRLPAQQIRRALCAARGGVIGLLEDKLCRGCWPPLLCPRPLVGRGQLGLGNRHEMGEGSRRKTMRGDPSPIRVL